jgi:hypothetical protein
MPTRRHVDTSPRARFDGIDPRPRRATRRDADSTSRRHFAASDVRRIDPRPSHAERRDTSRAPSDGIDPHPPHDERRCADTASLAPACCERRSPGHPRRPPAALARPRGASPRRHAWLATATALSAGERYHRVYGRSSPPRRAQRRPGPSARGAPPPRPPAPPHTRARGPKRPPTRPWTPSTAVPAGATIRPRRRPTIRKCGDSPTVAATSAPSSQAFRSHWQYHFKVLPDVNLGFSPIFGRHETRSQSDKVE